MFVFSFLACCKNPERVASMAARGTAARRRDRRSRTFWRREQQSIAMAVAAALHHTVKVQERMFDAPVVTQILKESVESVKMRQLVLRERIHERIV